MSLGVSQGLRPPIGAPEIDPEVIRAHLAKVLGSPHFRGSRRCSAFLEFVVTRALSGEWSELKERSIAVAVFGRAPDADLTEDTIVRVSAREVRKRLAQYGISPEAAGDAVRIDLAAGTYVPQFHATRGPLEKTAAAPPRPRGIRMRMLLALIAVPLLLAAAWSVMRTPERATSTDMFWRPILSSGSSALIGVGTPVAYQPSLESWIKSTAQYGSRPLDLQAPFEFPETALKGSDVVRVRDQFVGYGDLVSIGQVVSFLTEKQKPVHYRLASRIEFSELRDGPVILIGAFTNRWTIELLRNLPFRFSWGEGLAPQIEDTEGHRVWSVSPGLSNPNPVEDYLLITRLLRGPAGTPVLILAGLKQAGTEAAGYLATHSLELEGILKRLSTGWESGNLQVILHARVVLDRPAEIDVLAHRSW